MNSQQKYFESDPEVEYLNFPKLGKDSIVEKVVSKYQERSEVGIKKYNTTLDRKDLNLLDWLNHLQEELMDATLYIEKLKEDVNQ